MGVSDVSLFVKIWVLLVICISLFNVFVNFVVLGMFVLF